MNNKEETELLRDDIVRLTEERDTLLGILRVLIHEDDVELIDEVLSRRTEILASLEQAIAAIVLFRNEPSLGRLHKLRQTEGYAAMQEAMDVGKQVIKKAHGK